MPNVSIVLSAGGMHRLRVDYSETAPTSGPRKFALRWDTTGRDFPRFSIPSESLFAGSQAAHSPYQVTSAVGRVPTPCSGHGLTLATAGVMSSFTISAREGAVGQWFASATPRAGSGAKLSALPTAVSGGELRASYTATVAGRYDLDVTKYSQGGLRGEYYYNLRFHGAPAVTRVDPSLAFDWDRFITEDAYDHVAVRWTGLVRPKYSETYTFTLNTTNAGSRLAVGGRSLFDHAEDVEPESERWAAVELEADVPYELSVDLIHRTGNTSAFLFWVSQSQAKEPVPSTYLYYPSDVAVNSPFPLVVRSSPVTCGTLSTISGSGLSIATAGSPAVLRIQQRDVYRNQRDEGGDPLVVARMDTVGLSYDALWSGKRVAQEAPAATAVLGSGEAAHLAPDVELSGPDDGRAALELGAAAAETDAFLNVTGGSLQGRVRPGGFVQVGGEVMLITSTIDADVVAVLRAQQGTRAVEHLVGAAVRVLLPGSGRGDAQALRVQEGRVQATIGQATPWPGASNTLTVTLVSNVQVQHPGSVTLAGLGARTPSDSALAYEEVHDSGTAALFGGTLSWDRTTGTVVLAVASGRELEAGRVYQLSFQLQNPEVGRLESVVMVSASELAVGGPQLARPAAAAADKRAPGTRVAALAAPLSAANDTRVSLDADVTSSVFPSDMLRVDDELIRVLSVDASGVDVVRGHNGSLRSAHFNLSRVDRIVPGASSGDAALGVIDPAFYLRSIAQSSSGPCCGLCGATNSLSITLASNRALAAGATVRLDGLRGMASPDTGNTTAIFQGGIPVGASDSELVVANRDGIEIGSFVRIEEETLEVTNVTSVELAADATKLSLRAPSVAGIATGSYVRVGAEFLLVGAKDASFPGIFTVTRAVGCSSAVSTSMDVTVTAADMTVLNVGRSVTASDDAVNVAELDVMRKGAFARIGDEVIFIAYIYFGTRTLQVVRGAAGTSAQVHLDACRVSIEESRFLALEPLGTLGPAVTVLSDDALPIVEGTYIQIENEIMRVEAVSRMLINAVYYDGLTVTRGASGTARAAHAVGLPIVVVHSTSLASGISAADTNISLADGIRAGLAAGSLVKIEDEIVQVASFSSNGFAMITRAVARTTAASHAEDTTARVLLRATLLQAVANETTVSASATRIRLRDPTALAAEAGSYIQISDEVIRVVSVFGQVLTVVRGRAGTLAMPHGVGAIVRMARATRVILLYDGRVGDLSASFRVRSVQNARIVVGSYIEVNDESMLVTAIDGNTLTVSRGQLGTVAQVHAEASFVVKLRSTTLIAPTALAVSRAQAGSTAASHSDLTEVTTVAPIWDGGASLNAAGVFGGFGHWVRARGALSLTVASGQSLPAGRTVAFSVRMRNPCAALGGRAVMVSGLDGGGLVVEPATVRGGAALVVAAPGFAIRQAGQNSSGAGVFNTLSVTLSPNHDLIGPGSVTLAGLTGTQTNSSSALGVWDAGAGEFAAAFSASAQWMQDTGTLVLSLVAGGGLQAGSSYTFSFQVRNPSVAQASPTIRVSAVGSAPGGGSLIFSPAEVTRDPTQEPYGLRRSPLHVDTPAFVVKQMAQSTPYPGATNTITVTMVSNVDLLGDDTSAVTLLGLTGAATVDSASLSIGDVAGIEPATGVFGASADWTQDPGTLVLAVIAGETLSSFTQIALTFELTNPTAAQDAPLVNISASGSVAIASTPIERPSAGLTALCGSVAGDAHALKVYGYGFPVAIAGQGSTFPGGSNVITVTLVANVDLAGSDSSRLTLAGFSSVTGAASMAITERPIESGVVQAAPDASTVTLARSAPAAAGRFAAHTIVVDLDGDAATTDDAETRTVAAYSAERVVTLSATLAGVTAGTSTYSLSAAAAAVFDSSASFSGGVLTLDVASGATLVAGRGHVFTFAVTNPAASTSPSSTAVESIAASGSATVTVSTLARDTRSLPAAAVGALAAGADSAAGVLSLSEAAVDVRRGLFLRVRDEIMLVLDTISADVIVRRARGGTAARALDAGEAVLLVEPGAVPGDAAFGRVRERAFVLSRAGQSSPGPGANNTITVTLVANVALTAADDAAVTIAGLTGAATPDGSLDVDGPAALEAAGSWTQATGTFVLPLAGSLAAGAPAVFSFVLRNPASALAPPPLQLSATSSGGDISPSPLVPDPGLPVAAQGTIDAQLAGPPVDQRLLTIAAGGPALPLGAALAVGDEELRVTARGGSAASVVVQRGARGTAARVHPAGAPVRVSPVGALPGDAAPLRVRSSGVVLSLAGQSSPFPGGANTLTATIAANVALGAGDTLTLAGLAATQTSDNSSLPIACEALGAASNAFGDVASWDRLAGALVLTVAEGESLAALEPFTVSFSVTNRASTAPGKRASRPLVDSATGEYVMTFTPSEAGSALVTAARLARGGLFATLYGDADLYGAPRSQQHPPRVPIVTPLLLLGMLGP